MKTSHNWFPECVDIDLTSKCNLQCEFCWGPNHRIKDLLNTEDWKSLLLYLKKNGTKAIVITGGEPLLRKDIIDIVKYAKSLKLRITLSTNGILLKEKIEILNYIDELGIPLDSSTDEKGKKLRIGQNSHTSHFLEIMKLIASKEELYLTIRTVVSQKNIDDILNINKLLLDNHIKFDRWKLYQFAPLSYGELSNSQFEISTNDFIDLISYLKRIHPRINIHYLLNNDLIGRYVFIGSDGDVFCVDNNIKHKIIMNIKRNEIEELKDKITDFVVPHRNHKHSLKL